MYEPGEFFLEKGMAYYNGKFGNFVYDSENFKPIFDEDKLKDYWKESLANPSIRKYPDCYVHYGSNYNFDTFKDEIAKYVTYYEDEYNAADAFDEYLIGWESYNDYVPDGFDRNYNAIVVGMNNELQDQLSHMYFQLGMLERPPLRGPLHVTLKPTDYFLDNYADDVESKAEEYEKLGQPNADDLALFTTVGDKAYTSGLRIPVTVESYKNGVMEITSSVQKTKNADAEIFDIDNLTVDIDENGCKNADVMSISLNGIDMFVVNFAEDQRVMIGQKDRKITNKHKTIDVSRVYNKGLDISKSFDDYDNGVSL